MTLIIDGHTHVWPDAIAKQALRNPSAELIRFGDGTVAGLTAAMQAADINYAATLAVAHRPDMVARANQFVGGLSPKRFIPVGTVHPAAGIDANLSSLREIGARAVKLHPIFQGYALDDPQLIPLLDALQGEMPVIVHVGAGGSQQAGANSTPRMLRDVLLRLPRLDVIACHFGGYRALDEAERWLVGLRGVYLDTSWPPGLASLDPNRVRRIIKRHGTDRIVFATDWPMANPTDEVASIEALHLPDPETAAILGGTLSELLRFTP